ncbi:efflux RND transporter permease subunit [Candidatus Margulisiibacteriota bacterium]
MRLVKFTLKNTNIIFLGIAAFILLGVISYFTIPRETFPDVKIPYIFVVTTYPGASPTTIENVITRPIENKIKAINDIKEIKSDSDDSISFIFIEFETDVDIDDALQKVRDKTASAESELPKEAETPEVYELNLNNLPFIIINISSASGIDYLKKIADNLKNEIESVSGVLSVDIIGEKEREIQVNIIPEKFRARKYSFDLQQTVLQLSNIDIPVGSINLGDTRYSIRVPAEYRSIDEIKNTVLKAKRRRPVYVKDVAEVVDGFKDQKTLSRLNREETISIAVQKRSGENVIRIAKKIKKLVKENEKKLPSGVATKASLDYSKVIKRMVDEMENSILTGIILVIGLLYLFLGFRNSIFVGISIPLSLAITFICISLYGFTLNFIVLFSLGLVLGMLVDNAIVIVENIYRHRQEGLSPYDAAELGTIEVWHPVLSSTLTTIAAFAPIALWPGLMGEFMGYLPKVVITALAASYIVAIIVNPVITKHFMKVQTEDTKSNLQKKFDNKFQEFRNKYIELLKWALSHRKKVMTYTLVASLIAVIILVRLPKALFKEITPEEAYIHIEAPIATTLEGTNKIAQQVEEIVEKEKNIDFFITTVGSKGTGSPRDMLSADSDASSHIGVITLKFHEKKNRTENTRKTVKRIREKIKKIVGASIRLELQQAGPPVGAPIEVRISGEDMKTLKTISNDLQGYLKQIDGVINIKDDYQDTKPEIHIEVDKQKAQLNQVNPLLIGSILRIAINGVKATVFREGDDEYDITVRLRKKDRSAINDLNKVFIINADGDIVPLLQVARIKIKGGYAVITRYDYKRTVTITADVITSGKHKILPSKAQKIFKDILKNNKYKPPSEYFIKFSGENVEMGEAFSFLGKAFIAAIMLIAIILVSQFNSYILPAIILFTVLLSLIGVSLGLFLFRQPFGLMAFLGIISLAGIVVNNGIILIDFIEQLRKKGVEKIEAIISAGKLRFRPVILTALSTIIGLIPITFGFGIDIKHFRITWGNESAEWWRPMGASVMVGLLVATVLTLIVVPVMYSLIDKLRERFKLPLKINNK